MIVAAGNDRTTIGFVLGIYRGYRHISTYIQGSWENGS